MLKSVLQRLFGAESNKEMGTSPHKDAGIGHTHWSSTHDEYQAYVALNRLATTVWRFANEPDCPEVLTTFERFEGDLLDSLRNLANGLAAVSASDSVYAGILLAECGKTIRWAGAVLQTIYRLQRLNINATEAPRAERRDHLFYQLNQSDIEQLSGESIPYPIDPNDVEIVGREAEWMQRHQP